MDAEREAREHDAAAAVEVGRGFDRPVEWRPGGDVARSRSPGSPGGRESLLIRLPRGRARPPW